MSDQNADAVRCDRCGLPIDPRAANWYRTTTDGVREVYHPTCYSETYPLLNDGQVAPE
jgi:hypothetical protein